MKHRSAKGVLEQCRAGASRAVGRYISSEEDELRARYRDLYGEGNYEAELARHARERRRRILLCALLFILVVVYVLHGALTATPGAIYEDGFLVAVERPSEGAGQQEVDARLYVVHDGETTQEDRSLYISAYSEEERAAAALGEESEGDLLKRRIDQAVRQINKDRAERVATLPTSLEDGTRLYWRERRRSRLPLLAALLAGVLYYLFRSRFASIEGREQKARESVVRELPEFLHKLTLLLGAGVVLEVAFARAMEGMQGEGYFAEQMRYLKRRSEETNGSLPAEFYAFARRSGVRELMRIAGILEENVERGTDLVAKLRQEGQLLWFERKKQSEEKGRLAETKLTLPLAILLLVLVLVTVSPALFEM